MKASHISRIKVLVGAFLAVGLFGVSILSFVAMDHGNNHQPCAFSQAMSKDYSGPVDDNFCLNFHLGVLTKISQAVPADFQFSLLIFASLAVAAWVLRENWRRLDEGLLRLCIYLRQFFEKKINVFFRQLGYWLVLLEKRDPMPVLEPVHGGLFR